MNKKEMLKEIVELWQIGICQFFGCVVPIVMILLAIIYFLKVFVGVIQ